MKKSSIVLVLLLLISMVSYGCSRELSVKGNQLVGTWFSQDVECLWVFDDNGNLSEISPNSHNISMRNYCYSVNGNEISIEMQSSSTPPRVFNFQFSENNKFILADPMYDNEEVIEFSRVKDDASNEKAIIGTWTPIGCDSFDLHIGPRSFSSIEELSFYQDGTFRAASQKGGGWGEYTFLFDGEVLQMSVGDHGEFEYELFGDEFMLIEFSIYNGEMQFGYLLKKNNNACNPKY